MAHDTFHNTDPEWRYGRGWAALRVAPRVCCRARRSRQESTLQEQIKGIITARSPRKGVEDGVECTLRLARPLRCDKGVFI